MASSSGKPQSASPSFVAYRDVFDMPASARGNVQWLEGSNNRNIATSRFWGMIDVNGGYVDCNALAADTWATAIDISSGSGIVSHIFLPQIASDVVDTAFDVRVTVDGVEKIRRLTFDRCYALHLILGGSRDYSTANDTHLEDAASSRSSDGTVQELDYSEALLHPHMHVSQGFPVLPFEDSLKVEMKCSEPCSSTAQLRNFGVLLALTVEGSA